MEGGAPEARGRERMLQGGFVVAMAATISIARYATPSEILRPIRRWTIVSRFGPENEYLTLSTAAAIQPGQTEAPIGLSPTNTVFGILLSETESESMFLLLRHLPRGVNIAGTFFPAEGYAQLGGSFDQLHIRIGGRHAHSHGRLNTQDIRYDVPVPAPGSKWAMAWHVDAVHRPWSGEFFAARRGN